MAIDASTALIFLPFALPIGVWVAFNDMKFMKIPNLAVYTLFGVFVVVGLFALPLETWLWRFPQAFAVLVVGFFLNLGRALGAGDAKFLAAMAPYLDPDDALPLMQVFAAVLIAAFATHRLFRAVPAMRARFPDWKSWAHPKFPMGLALGGSLILYLALGALLGS